LNVEGSAFGAGNKVRVLDALCFDADTPKEDIDLSTVMNAQIAYAFFAP